MHIHTRKEVETCRHAPPMERSRKRVFSHQWVKKLPITLGPLFQDVTILHHLVHPINVLPGPVKNPILCWDPDWGTSFAEEVSRLWPQRRDQRIGASKYHRWFGRHTYWSSKNTEFLWISHSLLIIIFKKNDTKASSSFRKVCAIFPYNLDTFPQQRPWDRFSRCPTALTGAQRGHF